MLQKKRLELILSVAICLSAVLLSGCVERKLTINTQPQGALITLNDEEIGTSPVTVGFNWYGDYKVRATKQDFTTLNTHRLLKAPLHDHFPFDFIAEILWPGKIVDSYQWTFNLSPYQPPQREELIKGAHKMKETMTAEMQKSTKP